MEESLEESRFSSLLEYAQDIIIIIDKTGRVSYVNPAIEQILGYSPEELIGENAFDIVHPDDEVVERFAGLIDNPGKQTDRLHHRVKHKSGEWRWFESVGSNHTDEALNGYVINSRDITARKRREQKLRQFQEAVERTAHVVYITDTDGTIEYVNPAFEKITGFSKADAVGKTPRILKSGEYSDEYYDEFWETLLSGEQWEDEIIDRRADGETIVLSQTISPITDENGDPQKFVAVGHDITQRKEYKSQIKEQRDNLEILNQVVRHDIRNDLQVVLAFAETLEPYVQENGEKYVEKVLDAARNAVDITTTARDVTEVMLQSDVDDRPIPLRSTLRPEIEDLRTNHEHAQITVDGAIPNATVQADDMLESVFRNLLTNAIQHNDKDVPTVTVSATADEDTVLVRIADNGPGIPDKRKEEIFEQGEMGLDSTGTGLGLYLVDTLVGRYDGDVRVEDNDPEGAIFIVELPVADDV